MDTKKLISELRAEREEICEAIRALERLGPFRLRRRAGTPKAGARDLDARPVVQGGPTSPKTARLPRESPPAQGFGRSIEERHGIPETTGQ